jgi:blue copper oxidase
MRNVLPKKILPLLCAFSALGLGVQSQTFINELPIPYTVSGNTISLNVETATHNFNPNGNDSLSASIPTFCYNAPGNSGMSYLGPTQIWQKTSGNQLQQIHMTNNLVQTTTTHWHGVNLAAEDDGGPHEVYDGNGGTFDPSFPLMENPSTMWYHSHLMDSTVTQVTMGLAGMIILEDPADLIRPQLPHDYGVNDIPLVIQEKAFNFSNHLVTSINTTDSIDPNGQHHFMGNGKTTLMNGRVNTYFHVPASMVRFRILNGSIRKSFRFGVDTTRTNNSNFGTMYLVGTDGGYTAVPHSLDSTTISPGERMELVVDFSLYGNGDTVFLRNLNRSLFSPFSNPAGGYVSGGAASTPGNAFMAFIVDNSIQPTNPITSLPSTLAPFTIDTSGVSMHRTKTLYGASGGGHGSPTNDFSIDYIPMEMHTVNDFVQVNTKEIWTVWNRTDVNHPWHIHKVQFQVFEILDSTGPGTFTSIPIPAELQGWKDNVLVEAGWKLSYVANFDSFPSATDDPMNGYMYHCHILTHEDLGMMHQFVVVDTIALKILEKETSQFILYPNPASTTLSLHGETKLGGELRIVDLLGRTLMKEKVRAFVGSTEFDVSDLPRGIVMVEFTTGVRKFTKKVRLD